MFLHNLMRWMADYTIGVVIVLVHVMAVVNTRRLAGDWSLLHDED